MLLSQRDSYSLFSRREERWVAMDLGERFYEKLYWS